MPFKIMLRQLCIFEYRIKWEAQRKDPPMTDDFSQTCRN